MHDASDLAALLSGRRWLALTGAGMSTDSGIPDYRGNGSRPYNPILFNEFLKRPEERRRYWARSMQGWRSFGVAQPNAGHLALATLGAAVITQNVDGLHQAAGSSDVLDLHGRIDSVACLECGRLSHRAALQRRLEAANPGVDGTIPAGTAEVRPDGDAAVDDWHDFVVVACEDCGGVLKPDVVMFGESVPPPRVADAYARVDAAEALVVLGSSLTVMSGLRFVRHAARHGTPIAIVNRGATRADDLADVRLHAGTSETLTALADAS
ncbi:NAD-dependent protein deacetylase [Propioniciclava tarda]|uniref:NAD-dependent protein deacetylase n=1 Tax=Propioniciclava tarda TaxID=433330 RepID=UPI001174E3FC|nr:NAD-dependent protein deacetylase [Propioniciclava tarda]SMO50356.1 NAD-dependent protein deacetylase, SIR2 family [Propioniciclava tarda]